MPGPRTVGFGAFVAVLAFLAVLVAGCREIDPFGPDRLEAVAHPPVTVEPSLVLLEERESGWAGELTFTFHNLTGLPVSLPNCGDCFFLRLERLEGDDWVRAWGRGCFLCLSPPIEVRPGGTLTQPLPMLWGRPGSNWVFTPESSGRELEGTYRLVIVSAYVNANPEGHRGSRIPLEFRTSAPFEIRLAD